jgi:hypothetical protein
MTEEEWLTNCVGVSDMLTTLSQSHLASDRKTLLVGCAFCRQLRQMTVSAANAIEWVERQAERECSGIIDFNDELIEDLNEGDSDALWPGARPVWALLGAYNGRGPWGDIQSLHAAIAAVSVPVIDEIAFFWNYSGEAARRGPRTQLSTVLTREKVIQRELIRDIFGNPFHLFQFDPRWRTSNVIDLARTIYEERTFERLPILADALMDACCAEEQILSHCRSEGPHVRGCWVVDLVLGKE